MCTPARDLSDDIDFNNLQKYDDMELKFLNDSIIIEYIRNSYTLDEILNKYDNYEIDFKYEERFTECINILKEKESICDIKVVNFILKNYKNIELFITPNHPASCILAFISNEILKILLQNYQIIRNIFKSTRLIFWY
jgi:hypothetical protein